MKPEQQRALDYLTRKGTKAPAASIHAGLRQAFAAIEEALAAVPADLRERAPAAGKWSPIEILDHLVLSHAPAIDQLAALLHGESPGEVAIPAGLQSPAGSRPGWDELARRLHGVHTDFLALVAGAGDDLPLTATAVVEMVVKVAGPDGVPAPVHWYQPLDWKAFAQTVRAHTLEHRNQLERTLVVTAGRSET